MKLGHKSRTLTLAAGSESVQSPATLERKIFRSALWAPMFWKTGLPPGLSRFRATPRAVDPGLAPSGSSPRDMG
jgi:hypothetical protein